MTSELIVGVMILLVAAVLGGAGLLVTIAWRREARVRTSQQALRASEERLRLALEATSEVVWDWDLESDRMYQPRWAQAYGYPEEATPRTGRELLAYMHPDDLASLGAQMEAARHGERDDLELEHRMRTASGEWIWMLVRARVVARAPGGEARRLVGTCVDVTERRRMLERLQVADRMASVGTLAAGVAHEINNPLAFVNSNVAFALETLEDCSRDGATPPGVSAGAAKDCRIALQEALAGTARVGRIVKDLKLLSRPGDEPAVPVDVSRPLEAALRLARGDLGQRARVTTHLEEVPAVLGDESRLAQVFLNLLVNAGQAIPEGRPAEHEVEIRLGTEDGRVVVRVRDTGCGIGAQARARIFDPFFTTKPAGVGTGLGLAICQRIVASLGGEVALECTSPRGSTFRVSLPAAPGLQAAAEPPRSRRRATRAGRVLVVDDEPLFCSAVVRMIGGEHDVVALSDAREALRRIEAGERFDVVLADVVMPAMNGAEFHAAVARVAPDLASAMLFVTGGAVTKDAVAFLAGMGDRVLEKPVAPDDVRAAIAAVLAAAPVSGTPATA